MLKYAVYVFLLMKSFVVLAETDLMIAVKKYDANTVAAILEDKPKKITEAELVTCAKYVAADLAEDRKSVSALIAIGAVSAYLASGAMLYSLRQLNCSLTEIILILFGAVVGMPLVGVMTAGLCYDLLWHPFPAIEAKKILFQLAKRLEYKRIEELKLDHLLF